MPQVQSYGALVTITGGTSTPAPSGGSSLRLFGSSQTYAELYKRQPNIRTMIDFVARNCAQLAVHAFRRLSDTDRERLPDHELIQWLDHPNPDTTRYRLIEDLVADLGVYFNAYWLKVRLTGPQRLGFVRVPPDEMVPFGGLLKAGFRWTVNGRSLDFAPSEIVHFDGYNPTNSLCGLSQMETLRQILAEEAAAAEHRALYWQNASRMDGVIERPGTAPKWTTTQKTDFRAQWQSRFSGAAGAGQVAVLEDGMTFKPTSFSARESEYLSARKLSTEECARAFHIPLSMVGILGDANYANIREQHNMLYQDCLGPILEMILQEFVAQILPECDDQEGVYLEFNIAAKMAGSFEEQAASLQMTVGRPIMTLNEGRARLNLPAITDDPSADTVAPQQGGPAAPTVSSPSRFMADPQQADSQAIAAVVRTHWTRQRARLAKAAPDTHVATFAQHAHRWTTELSADLLVALHRAPGADLMPPTWYAPYLAAAINDETQQLLAAGADAFADGRKVIDV